MSAPKPYFSPFHLLEAYGLTAGGFSPEKIEIAKAKLQEFNEAEEMNFEGRAISVSLIQDQLNELNVDNWSHHAIIFSQKGLKDFLEKDIFDPDALDKAYAYRYKPSFVQFVSPYFVFSFLEISKTLLQKKDDFASLSKMLDFSGFIAASHKLEAFSNIRDFITEQIIKIRTVSWESFSEDESLLYFIFSSSWKNSINKLPEELWNLSDSLNEEAFRLIERIQSRASLQYLHEAAIQLGNLTKSENLKSELREFETRIRKRKLPQPLVKENSMWETRAIWFLVGFCVIGLIFILSYVVRNRIKNEEVTTTPYEITQSYPDEMVESPANDDLNSSVNEKNFKTFISMMGKVHVNGKSLHLKTGQSPFNNVSKPLLDDGRSTFKIKNLTGFDAVLFYFTSENLLIDTTSRVYAVYIKSGEAFEFLFDHNYGRFNLAFGEQWMHYQNSVDFNLIKSAGVGAYNDQSNERLKGKWKLSEFFKKPIAYQFYMNHDLLIQDFPQPNQQISGAPAAKVLYEPSYAERSNRFAKKTELTLIRSGNQIKVEAKGSLYVFESPENFQPIFNGK